MGLMNLDCEVLKKNTELCVTLHPDLESFYAIKKGLNQLDGQTGLSCRTLDGVTSTNLSVGSCGLVSLRSLQNSAHHY